MNARSYVIEHPPQEAVAAVRNAGSGRAESRQCHWCHRGEMQREYRASLLDFTASFAGLIPTICDYCETRGQRFYPRRMLTLVAFLAIAFGWVLTHAPKRLADQNKYAEAPSPVVFVEGHALAPNSSNAVASSPHSDLAQGRPAF
jgi:hypothetical protein